MVGTQEEITDKMISEFSKTVEMFDFTPAEANLFSYLYLKKEPMTLDEMSEALGKSKTSMSTSVRSLAHANLVTRAWKKGVRKDLYKANTQLYKIFMNNYMNKWIEAANYQKIALEDIYEQIKQLPKEISCEPEIDLEGMITFHDQLKTVFKNMKPDD